MKGRLYLPVFFLFLSAVSAFSAFMEKPGTRPTALGGAYTAISDDAYAPQWNPAGLGQIERFEAALMYSNLYSGIEGGGINYGYLGLVLPLQRLGTVGTAWSYMDGGIYNEHVINLCYAKDFHDFINIHISIGIGAKLMIESFAKNTLTQDDEFFKKYGFTKLNPSFDVALFSEPVDNFTIGFVAEDILEPNLALNPSNTDKLPRKFSAGISYRILKLIPFIDTLIPTMDFTFRNKKINDRNDINFKFGMEAWVYNNNIAFRLGGNANEIATGVALKFNFLGSAGGLDYAFVFPLMSITNTYGSHRVALVFKYGRELVKESSESKQSQFVDDIRKAVTNLFMPPKPVSASDTTASDANIELKPIGPVEIKPEGKPETGKPAQDAGSDGKTTEPSKLDQTGPVDIDKNKKDQPGK